MNLFALPFLVLSITLAATPFADATISTIFNNCCQIRSRSVGFVSSQRKKYTNRKRESFDGNDFNLLCPHQNDGEKSAHKNMYQFQVGFRRRQLNLEMSSSNEGMLQENFDSNNSLEENAHFDRELRFSGVGRLFANKEISNDSPTIDTSSIQPHINVLNRLSSATVAVIGLGGVGSWTAEALCRSGIGNLILMDLDDICISNTNRQLHALSSTVGKMKIDEIKNRLVDINPGCNVTLIHDFVSVENADNLIESLLPEITVVIDAIDGMYEKTALILACVNHGVPIVTCGGAAGRSDPTQIVLGDLTEVQEDRLLFKCRKELRQRHGFPKVPIPKSGKKARVRKWRIPAVYSTEVQKMVKDSQIAGESSFRRCDGALGTACFVTGTYGFVAASKVIGMIGTNNVVSPKKQRKA